MMFPGMNVPGFDPSKMSPQAIAEVSELIRSLPPAQVVQMQTLMHNAMAGFDTRADMEAFERALPPGFRERMMGIMARAYAPTSGEPRMVDGPPKDVVSARLTVLRAVASGTLSVEAALTALFPEG